ncbi:MAG: hypothetical protein LEGION0403_FIIPPAGN_02886 [Legionella sp.]|uniref:hypothetical protein n=1 Tax=Legionella sp. TaxID=459 RepID=UPI003D127066
MIDKRTIQKAKELELAVPDGGFSDDFINSIKSICSQYDGLQSAYLVLKKEDDDICFLFGFQFGEAYQQNDLSIKNIMNDILGLFEEGMAFEGVCLGNNTKLKRAIEEITEPFFIELNCSK